MKKLESKENLMHAVRGVLSHHPDELQLYRKLEGPDITFQFINLSWFAGQIVDAVLSNLEANNRGDLFVCEHCGDLYDGAYCSTADCNDTGVGVTVCQECCERHDRRLELRTASGGSE